MGLTDQDLIAIIAQGIVDGTDLDCTLETQAREVLRQLRDAGVIVGADWTPPEDKPNGYECLARNRVTGVWRHVFWRDGRWLTKDVGSVLISPTAFAPITAPEAP